MEETEGPQDAAAGYVEQALAFWKSFNTTAAVQCVTFATRNIKTATKKTIAALRALLRDMEKSTSKNTGIQEQIDKAKVLIRKKTEETER